MGKQELLEQILELLSADNEIIEVRIKYLNGEEIRFDLENEYAEMVQQADDDEEDEDEDYEDYEEKAKIQIETDESNEEDEEDED
ncbi:MAG TPA: hypothetical protein VN374_03240 [Desulfitobacteriaceae bacterium]|nr:hypothetical protein [Desulfitobacteriaceae bacterium]